MTPPDSGDLQHECRCGYHIVGRDAEGSHTWSKCKPHSGERCCDLADKGHRAGCPGKPDSGEREVACTCNAQGRPHALYCDKVWDQRDWSGAPPSVSIPLSLAQRILAALEECGEVVGPGIIFPRHTDLAAELRAIVERKPDTRKEPQ